jgi:uncharacterized protein YciI
MTPQPVEQGGDGMPLWICLFEDDEQMLAVRSAKRAEHHAYLERHRDTIVMAGALLPSDAKRPTGAAWVLHAKTCEAAEELIAKDPYFLSGHRKYSLFRWRFARERDNETLLPLLVAQGAGNP